MFTDTVLELIDFTSYIKKKDQVGAIIEFRWMEKNVRERANKHIFYFGSRQLDFFKL